MWDSPVDLGRKVRSLPRRSWLGAFVLGPRKRCLHPLLLERGYWRNRLQMLELVKPSVVLIPRPELSTPVLEVAEFRLRAHDGVRLFGLRAKSHVAASREPARVRVVGPCDLPAIDLDTRERGGTEFVLQVPAGRRLEDRVLDVLRVCQLAAADHVLDVDGVQLVAAEQEPDEFLIASQLLADEAGPLGRAGEGFDRDAPAPSCP